MGSTWIHYNLFPSHNRDGLQIVKLKKIVGTAVHLSIKYWQIDVNFVQQLREKAVWPEALSLYCLGFLWYSSW